MEYRRLTRRSFIRTLGKGTLAIAVFGPVACSDSSSSATSSVAATTSALTATTTTTTPADTTMPSTTKPASGGAATSWERVALGGVSAYIIARGSQAVIVDTGNPGSEPTIETALSRIGLNWDAVAHVVLTHRHPDHVGSLGGVMENAVSAMGYAGAADLDAISSPRALTAVGDGDEVFGLQIIDTPGHTLGSISVLDPEGGVLVAGDALNTAGGSVAGSDPRFTADQIAADASVQKLATYEYEVMLPGHGEPITALASQQVAAFAASI